MSKKPASPACPHFVFAKDGFYGDIARVHRAAQQAQYHELEHATGWRSTGASASMAVKGSISGGSASYSTSTAPMPSSAA